MPTAKQRIGISIVRRGVDIDHALLHQVRRFITGANIHAVKTWLFAYETSQPGSSTRTKYERKLRGFVADQNRILLTYNQAELARERGTAAMRQSKALNETVDELKSQ
jgi:hypothetical protein